MRAIIQKGIKDIGRSFVHLVYPLLCLHCGETISDPHGILCEACLIFMELIDPIERCPHCFSSHYNGEQQHCLECAEQRPIIHRLAAAFDYAGPPASLIKRLKYSDQPYLAKGIGAYLAVQLLRLEWPLPDVIIPVPIAFTHWMWRGYNQSQLLAQSIGEMINCPLEEALVRKSGDYSQAGLSRKQRTSLDGALIRVKAKHNLYDKRILLVDDVMTTGSTMRKCAEALLEACPATIYGLVACRAVLPEPNAT